MILFCQLSNEEQEASCCILAAGRAAGTGESNPAPAVFYFRGIILS